MTCESTRFDVAIIGGGPVGLLTAYCLQRMGVSTCVVERLDKEKMPMYGRACTLYPRTLEMLDQVELLDRFLQIGLVAHNGTNFDSTGKRVSGRGWQRIFSQYRGTFFDYFLSIRLKYSESLIQAAYKQGGGHLLIGWDLRDLKLSTNKDDGCRITVQVAPVDSSATTELRWQVLYLIGADGGNSLVRSLSGIPFHQDKTTYQWVRIDGVVKTNMPDSRIGVTGIESVSHGNVLWVPLDHGRTRIGFALNEELHKKYGDKITEEQAKHEAIQAVQPFDLEFESVDWYTIYSIRQGVAEQYMINDCILLAGDACHTHSSGAAQGMNTGIHDAVNLSWKLGGVLRGWYKPEILHTYDSERRPIARTLIEHDKQYSTLISGDKVPNALETDVNQLLANLMLNSADFVLGLGIGYEENLINLSPNAGCLCAGSRPDDALLYGPGRSVPVRLQQVTLNTGAFWLLVFTGNPEITRERLRALRCHLDASRTLSNAHSRGVIKYMTIINGCKPQGEEAMGMASFGLVYYDHHAIVQEKFGFTETEGGIAVLRPDGYLGFATSLDRGSEVDGYLRRFVAEPSQLMGPVRL
ncbi:FAD binding domain-containing protein [Cladophialophora immunda]|nr:FAD binding domain-containing protein [Cladophialophora immunda]